MFGSSDGRFRRTTRRFLLGSGPLKRASDRAQMAGRLFVVVSLLAAVPLAILAAGLTRTRLEAVAASQAAERHQVHAVVTQRTEEAPSAAKDDAAAGAGFVQAAGRWRAPGGAVRRGHLIVPAGTTPGTTVPVWVDRTGALTTAPLDRTSIGDSAVVAGVATTVAIPLLAWALHCGLCVVLDVRRRRRWGRDWARVEREWRARLG